MFLAVLVTLAYSLLYLPSFQTFVAHRLASYLRSSYGLPIKIDKVKIEFIKTINLEGVYVGEVDHPNDTLIYAGNIEVDISAYNLDKSTFLLDHLGLKNAKFNLIYTHPDSLSNLDKVIALFDSGEEDTTTSTQPFHMESQELVIENLQFRYKELTDSTHEYGMDYENMNFYKLFMHAEDVVLYDDSIMADLNNFSVREQGGFVVNHISGDFTVARTVSEIKNLQIRTPNSDVVTYAKMSYSFWDAFPDYINRVKMNFDMKESKVSTKDIAYFAPELKDWNQLVRVSGEMRGPVTNMKGRNLHLLYGTGTEFTGDADISGLPDFGTSFINIKAESIRSNGDDVQNICDFAVDTGIVIPQEVYNLGQVVFAGSFTGFPNEFTSYGVFTSQAGVLKTDLTLRQNEDSTYFYKGRLITEAFDLGMLTAIKDLGTLTSNVNVEGSGFNVKELQAVTTAEFKSFYYKGYQYKDIKLDGEFEQSKFMGQLTCFDQNANFDFDGILDFNTDRPGLDFDVAVYALNLSKLNLLPDSVGAELSATFKLRAQGYKISDITGVASIENLSYCQRGQQYYISKAELRAKNNPREIDLFSPIADISIKGNFIPEELPNSFLSVVSDAVPSLQLMKKMPVKKKLIKQEFSFNAKLKEPGFLKEFIPDSLYFDPGTTISGFYDNTTNVFEVNLASKYLKYGDYAGSNINLFAKKVNEIISADLASGQIDLGDSLLFNKVDVLAKAINDNLQFSLSWVNNDRNRAKLEGVGLIQGPGRFNFDILPVDIVIDGKQWVSTGQTNVFYDSARFNIRALHLISGNQEIIADGKLSRLNSDKLSFSVKNFDMHTIKSFYPIPVNIEGEMNANGYISNPYENLNFQANVDIETLKINGEELGKFTFDGNWLRSDSSINIIAAVEKNNYKNFSLSGVYRPFDNRNSFDMKLKMTDFNLIALNAMGLEEINDFRGYVSGAVNITGSTDKPQLKGSLTLKDAQMHVAYLNTTYYLNDKIQINPEWIGFNRIIVYDEQGNKAIASGTVNHRNYSKWDYDFSIDMKDFMCLNLNSTQNPLFYGTAFASGDVNISGYEDNLDIEVKAVTRKGTRIAIPLGGSEEVYAQEFVRFVNKKEAIAIEEEFDFSGIRLNLDIEATDDAEVKLIFDEKMGDVITGKGNGRINLEITPSGDFKMFGRYEITSGDYLFTLKNVVNKHFYIRHGGTIQWTGSPYDAYIDMFAEYNTTAALYDIMSTNDERYRRREQVKCVMHMMGRLLEPRIRFDIVVPGADDFVRGQLAVVTRDENELNKQFLSLLVANRFTPLQNGVKLNDQQAGGSAVGSNSMELLSNQLTNWLSGVSTDFTLGVNLRSGDATNSGQYTVSAGTRLFNNRVNVYTNLGYGGSSTTQQTVTGQNANTFVGDVTIEGNLTKDGRLKIKAFNQTTDNVYSSSSLSPYIQGVGVSYQETFDSFAELKRNLIGIFSRKKKPISNPDDSSPAPGPAPGQE